MTEAKKSMSKSVLKMKLKAESFDQSLSVPKIHYLPTWLRDGWMVQYARLDVRFICTAAVFIIACHLKEDEEK